MRDRLKKWLLGCILKSRAGHRWLAHRRFRREFGQFKALSEARPARFALRWEDRYPCLNDRTDITEFDHRFR